MSQPLHPTPPGDDDLRVESPQGRCIIVPATALQWTAVRSAGPGGQNVNKLSTKIDLRFDLQGCASVPAAVGARLRADPAVRFDARGCIIVTSQQARTQAGNLAMARRKLAALLAAAIDPPTPRRKTRPSASSRRRRLSDKRAQSERKAGRGRVHGE
ncbi:MAG: aminoacyl-tRNA hydrolase [Nannocystaceae bacterium]|nr:aminoacyl-tRNA hydrolase [Nannocystaceae bacterium]